VNQFIVVSIRAACKAPAMAHEEDDLPQNFNYYYAISWFIVILFSRYHSFS
jgi:hypothetical protein